MRYELGNMDRYSMAANGTEMENASFFKAFLDETVDADRLLKAVRTALEYHPLFKCKMMYDKQYYLEDNENPEILIFHRFVRPDLPGIRHGDPGNADLCF